jgi:HSP20 family protein
VAQFPFIRSEESQELADHIRALFDDLAAGLQHHQRALSGECHPSLDVLETDTAIEIVLDVSGVPREAMRVLFRSGVVIIAGEKAPEPASADHTFHLVEREFGRFARVVRLSGAFDVEGASATVREGELHIWLPKLTERRGQSHHIEIRPDTSRPA